MTMNTVCCPETLVLEALGCMGAVTIEELLAKLPEVSWNQVFLAVDGLSRQGLIRLHRRGFDFEVTLSPASL